MSRSLFRKHESLHLRSLVTDLFQFCFWLSASSVCLYVPQKCCGADRCIDFRNATQQAIYIDYNNTCGNPATNCTGALRTCSYNATTAICEVDPPPAIPTGIPTGFPTGIPTGFNIPSGFQTGFPTGIPTGVPTFQVPTGFPTFAGSCVPIPTPRECLLNLANMCTWRRFVLFGEMLLESSHTKLHSFCFPSKHPCCLFPNLVIAWLLSLNRRIAYRYLFTVRFMFSAPKHCSCFQHPNIVHEEAPHIGQYPSML